MKKQSESQFNEIISRVESMCLALTNLDDFPVTRLSSLLDRLLKLYEYRDKMGNKEE